MKSKKTSNPFKKGNKYAREKEMQLFLGITLLFAIVCLISIFVEPTHAAGIAGFSGSSFASMMLIGSVDGVSDKETCGSNIGYQVYLIDVQQVNKGLPFPKANANREVGNIPMKPGEYMQYFEAHDIPTFLGSGEKGDITTSGTNKFGIVMGGMRDVLLNFIEEHTGGKFIILFKEIGSNQWYILGDTDRPMLLKSFESKNDKEGRYITFSFERASVQQYYKYVGVIVTSPPVVHTPGATSIAIKTTNNAYEIPNGASATYAIASVSGLTANDKGRYITLTGSGTDKAATIADNASFVLEDGATWTAKAGSSITLRVLDPATLIEVPGSRIQTA